MAVSILQTLVGLIFVLTGMALADRPLTTKKEQWLCRSIFIFLGLVLVSLSWIHFRNEQRKEAEFREKIQAATARLAMAQPPSEKETVVTSPRQPDLQQTYQTLLHELATNSSIAPDVREHIIIATAKAAKQAEPEEDFSAAQSAKDKVLPYFDYAIKSLATMSQEQALLKGDKSLLDYHGLPQQFSPDAKTGKRSRITAAEIKFQTNPDWNLQVSFAEVAKPEYQANISVTCKGGVLVLKNAGDQIEARVEDLSGEASKHEPATGDEAKTMITDAVKKLVASEADAVEVKR